MDKSEFCEKMKIIASQGDTESSHSDADELMCALLYDLGYGEGVEIFENMYKWYA